MHQSERFPNERVENMKRGMKMVAHCHEQDEGHGHDDDGDGGNDDGRGDDNGGDHGVGVTLRPIDWMDSAMPPVIY